VVFTSIDWYKFMVKAIDCQSDNPLFENSIETYLTIPEIMDKLKVSRSTIYRFIKKNNIQPANLGRSRRFRPSDINDALS
jgi:excisionase family DNA binding protein